jgi:hypothetical protein
MQVRIQFPHHHSVLGRVAQEKVKVEILGHGPMITEPDKNSKEIEIV